MKCKIHNCHSYATSTTLCPRHSRQAALQFRQALTTTESPLRTPIVTRCNRCGETSQCQTWDTNIHLCADCVRLVVLEWDHRAKEFGQLQEGA